MHKAIGAMNVARNAYMRSERGFTLVEIMIVVAIISIMSSVAIPNFIRYRRIANKNVCISNLRRINHAYEQAKLAGLTPQDVSSLCGPDSYLKSIPHCPSSGSNTYSLPQEEGGNPTCSNSSEDYPHALPAGSSS